MGTSTREAAGLLCEVVRCYLLLTNSFLSTSVVPGIKNMKNRGGKSVNGSRGLTQNNK